MTLYPSDKILNTYAPLVPVPDCKTIYSHIAPDFFLFWEEFEKEQNRETDIPYWAAVWPGAKLLATYILQNPSIVKNKKILDFGSGSGVVSIAASKAGALHITANDIDYTAQYVAKKNFMANNANVNTSVDNMLINNKIEKFDVVFASDMFYERSTAKPTYDFMKKQIEFGALVIIADGTRPFTPRECMHPLLTKTLSVNNALEGMPERTVTLFMMS